MPLPVISEVSSSQSELQAALSMLLEPSSSLINHLVPALMASIAQNSEGRHPESYDELVQLSEQEVARWTRDEKADFLSGHPRIGEVKGLSVLSTKEQGGKASTPPEVLAKLQVELLHVSFHVSHHLQRHLDVIDRALIRYMRANILG